MMRFDVPVDPGPDEAREWIITELTRPPYQAAQPTLLDRISKAISDWLGSLEFVGGDAPPSLGTAVVLVLVIAALVVAFLVFGVPRLNRRSAVAGALFGDDDARDSAAMRADAVAAAARGEYALAIEEMFRAVARGLAERVIVTTTPGTTARGFAARAAAAFPDREGELTASAASFDDVRYLGKQGTEANYRQVAALEAGLRAGKPVLQPARA